MRGDRRGEEKLQLACGPQAYKVPPGTLETVQKTLTGWTLRMIAQGMMGTISLDVIGNPAYNTCANIITHLLGGPATATAKIHAIDGGFASVRIGRYQLTPRTSANDNVASVAAFGRCLSICLSIFPLPLNGLSLNLCCLQALQADRHRWAPTAGGRRASRAGRPPDEGTAWAGRTPPSIPPPSPP